MTAAQPERKWEEEAWTDVEIPAPTMPRRILKPEHVEVKGFPCPSARTFWRDARAAGHQALATYSIGAWMSANMRDVLEPECHTVAVWVRKADGSRLRATWIRRPATKKGETVLAWAFVGAFCYDPAMLMNTKEMKTWLAHPAPR